MIDPATHPTHAALLRAVLAGPADDAPRLVLADWLEETGTDPARAEFIRAQCELAGMVETFCPCDPSGRLPGSPGGTIKVCPCRWCRLRRRERELLNLPLKPQSAAFAWSMPLHRTGALLGRPWPDVITFRRGFVEHVTLTAADWLTHADAVLAAQPVTAVTLTTRPDPDRLTALAVSRPAASADPAELEGLFGETSATRWCLRRLWPGVTFTLPDRPTVFETVAAMNRRMREPDPDDVSTFQDPPGFRTRRSRR